MLTIVLLNVLTICFHELIDLTLLPDTAAASPAPVPPPDPPTSDQSGKCIAVRPPLSSPTPRCEWIALSTSG